MNEMPSIQDIKQFKYDKKVEAIQQNMIDKQLSGEYLPEIQRAPPAPGSMIPQSENPFMTEQYQNLPIPDAPINYGGGIAENLLNDNEVPAHIKEKYWFVFHKDNVLTFLDKERKDAKLLSFDITKIDILNSIPYYDYTFEKELEFGIMRNVMETKLDRAMGMNGGNIKNERIMLQSQFSEQRQISEISGGNQVKSGFFKRLLGRR